ncbi:TonB-dependent receptor domain-containing protein [Aurantiacibacter hainanensis]|uniref:TonB-dependent receptor domain-containing protein n=1 Tax=Aurantiacibacter hainanensis TaxID=3076114 RepID=UPI0030C6BFD8
MIRSRSILPLAGALAIATTGGGAQARQQPGAEPGEGSIIVTGSRIARPDEASASPIQTARHEDFVLTGVASVEQTLNLLPQIQPSFTNTSNNPGTGAATLDLRGLGSVRTLVLVNGRRWIASNAGEVPEVDVNTIPAALIERVDIVTGGASAVYGSDAVTGVINFLLKDDFDGLHLDVRQNLSERGDARVSSADLSFGTDFAGGRGRLIASLGWLDQAPVLHSARLLSREALADNCAVPGTRGPTGASTPVNDPTCAPPNELALVASGSPAIPGARFAPVALFEVPGSDLLAPNGPGLRFDADGTPRPFVGAFDSYNFAPANYLQVGFERWSGNLLASVDLPGGIEPYVELSLVHTTSPQQLAPAPFIDRVSIALDNPFLTPEAREVLERSYGVDAAGQRAIVGSPATGVRVNPAFTGDADGMVTPFLFSRVDLGPRRSLNEREAWRALAGVRWSPSPDWTLDVHAKNSRVEHQVFYENAGSTARFRQALDARRDASGTIVCRDASNGCAPIDIFGPGRGSAESADFIRAEPQDLTIVEEQVVEGFLTGSLPFLEAGAVGIAAGAGWRRNSYDFRPDPLLLSGDILGFMPGTPAAGSVSQWELFTEARIPVIADAPFAEDLNFELGARYSDYSRIGGAWTFKALSSWSPVEALRLRGGYQRAVRAPNVRELFAVAETTVGFVGDPCSNDFPSTRPLTDDPAIAAACIRNGVPAEIVGTQIFSAPLVTSSGNPALGPETAQTWTAGAILSPMPGLRLGLDYYDIRIADAIASPEPIVLGCIAGALADPQDLSCRSFQRASDGTIVSLTTMPINFGSLQARGIDWQASFNTQLGLFSGDDRVNLLLSGTHYFENSYRTSPTTEESQCAGSFGRPCGNTIGGSATPRWKLFNQLSYSWDDFRFSLRHRWFSATRDARFAQGRTFGLPPPRLPAEGEWLEARHYLDAAVTVGITANASFTLGVNNLTDAKPAITGTNQVQANTDPSLYDVLGRRFFLNLTLSAL